MYQDQLDKLTKQRDEFHQQLLAAQKELLCFLYLDIYLFACLFACDVFIEFD